MKKVIYISIFLIILILGFWGWQFYHAKSLLSLRSIEINEVHSIHLWVAEKEEYSLPKKVEIEKYSNLVELFNKYKPVRISEETIPLPKAQIIFNLDRGTVIISYGNDKIYVSRNDVNSGVSEYMLLDAPKLKMFFKELIKQPIP